MASRRPQMKWTKGTALLLLVSTSIIGWSGISFAYRPFDSTDAAVADVGQLEVELALLWQIYSRCFSLQIHFLQCGHRCGGGRAMSSRMASRTAGKVGRGGSPLILFFPPCCF